MSDGDWKKRLGVVYSTNPDFVYDTGEEAEADTPEPSAQKLTVRIDRKGRSGKQVTLVDGFVGRTADLETLGKTLKVRCGVGGSVSDGQILIQGDQRDKVTGILVSLGYKAKRGN